MKRNGILHAQLMHQVSLLGHTDRFVIADSGLPLPRTIPLIDLALVPGTISFQSALDALLAEVVVQRYLVAVECGGTVVEQWLTARAEHLGEGQSIRHEDLKNQLAGIAFAVRTGEQTPYANIICESGVPF